MFRSRDWANLDQRMQFIFELFRTRQKSLELFDPPFLYQQRLAIATDQLPTGTLVVLENAEIAGFCLQHLAVEHQQADEVHAAQDEQADDEISTGPKASGGDTSTTSTMIDHTSAPTATGSSKSPRSNAPFLRSNRRCTAR